MELRISLAGHLRIEADGTAMDGPSLGSLSRLAPAYLVTERHRPVPTDELARVSGADDPPPTGRTALRGLASTHPGQLPLRVTGIPGLAEEPAGDTVGAEGRALNPEAAADEARLRLPQQPGD